MIETTIPAYTGVIPDRTKVTSPTEFAEAVYAYKLWIVNQFVPTMEPITNEINSTALAMQGFYNSVKADRTSIDAAKAQTLNYRNDALAAKNEIESYVIPTSATYSPETIESKIQTTRLESFLGFNF